MQMQVKTLVFQSPMNERDAEAIDNEVNQYLAKGWELFETYTASVMTSVTVGDQFRTFYVLTRES